MRIYFDNIIFSLQKAGGISVYWYELIKGLYGAEDIHFITSKKTQHNLFGQLLDFNDRRVNKELPIPTPINRYFPTTARLATNSLFHSSYYRVALQPSILNIVTVHDFTYEYYRTGIPRLLHSLQKWLALRFADGIICVSNNTRTDMLKLYPRLRSKRQTVIHLATDSTFCPSSSGQTKKPPYILFVGSRMSKYKNFKLAVEALGLLKNYCLAIVGSDPLSKNEKEHITRHIGDRYKIYLSPSTESLNDLYNRAFCLLYPSMYEGFGLPVLEALSSGCPVVATNRSSIPEVTGTAGIVLNELRPRTIADAIMRLENPTVREKYISAGLKQASKFSWQRCVSETLDFYQHVYDDVFNR